MGGAEGGDNIDYFYPLRAGRVDGLGHKRKVGLGDRDERNSAGLDVHDQEGRFVHVCGVRSSLERIRFLSEQVPLRKPNSFLQYGYTRGVNI